MSKAFKKILPVAALGATGLGLAGISPLAGALGSAAGGAGLTGAVGTAGNALAAQGAAGLLGGAGAAAAGYGAPLASAALGAASTNGMAAFGNNGEFIGKTIESELTANPFTGGFDGKNFLTRGFDQLSSNASGGGITDGLKFGKSMMQPQQPQQTQPQNQQINTTPQQGGFSSPQSFVASANYNTAQPTSPQEIIERRRMEWLQNLGRTA